MSHILYIRAAYVAFIRLKGGGQVVPTPEVTPEVTPEEILVKTACKSSQLCYSTGSVPRSND